MCASEDSHQTVYPRILISLCCALNSKLRTKGFFIRTETNPIRLDGFPGLAESSLGAHVILFACFVMLWLINCMSTLCTVFPTIIYRAVAEIVRHHISTVTTVQAWCTCTVIDVYKTKLSRLMRLWYFSSSVNSFFKRACAAIQWGEMSDFCSDTSSVSILHVCEQRRHWRDCADAQVRLSLRWSPM